jgi:hypothetical protein
MRLAMLDEVQGLLLGHHVDVAHSVLVRQAVDLVRDFQDFSTASLYFVNRSITGHAPKQ